jgi:hypothetical protein
MNFCERRICGEAFLELMRSEPAVVLKLSRVEADAVPVMGPIEVKHE